MHKLNKTLVRCLVSGFLLTFFAFNVVGCSNNQAVESESYKKLPPGEGERRLQDTLKRRAQGRALSAPLPANASIDQSK